MYIQAHTYIHKLYIYRKYILTVLKKFDPKNGHPKKNSAKFHRLPHDPPSKVSAICAFVTQHSFLDRFTESSQHKSSRKSVRWMPSCSTWMDERTGRETKRHDEPNSCFAKLCESAYKMLWTNNRIYSHQAQRQHLHNRDYCTCTVNFLISLAFYTKSSAKKSDTFVHVVVVVENVSLATLQIVRPLSKRPLCFGSTEDGQSVWTTASNFYHFLFYFVLMHNVISLTHCSDSSIDLLRKITFNFLERMFYNLADFWAPSLEIKF